MVPFAMVQACQAGLRVLQATLRKDLHALHLAMALLGPAFLKTRVYVSKLKHCVSDAFVCGATMMAASGARPDELAQKLPVIVLTINKYLGDAHEFDNDLKSQMLNSFFKGRV